MYASHYTDKTLSTARAFGGLQSAPRDSTPARFVWLTELFAARHSGRWISAAHGVVRREK